MTIYFSLIEIVLLAVLCPKFSTVTGNQFPSDQIKMSCNLNSGPEDLIDGFRIFPAKISDSVYGQV